MFSRLPESPRVTIQKNRSVSMFLLYFLFLVAVDRDVLGLPDEIADPVCQSVGGIIHFLGLCTFSWTLLEGQLLYTAIVRRNMIDEGGKYDRLKRYIFGYGLPGAVVGLTLAVAYVSKEMDAYEHGEDGYCWLKENTFIWAFAGPAAFVIVVNAGIFVKALVVAREVASRRQHDSKLAEYKSMMKTWITLSFLLGITWAFGFLINGKQAEFMAYIFIVLNGSNGIFIFVNTVLMNESVMAEVKIRIGCLKKQDVGFTYSGYRSQALSFKRKKSNQLPEPPRKPSTQPEFHWSADSSESSSAPSLSSLSTEYLERQRGSTIRSLEDRLEMGRDPPIDPRGSRTISDATSSDQPSEFVLPKAAVKRPESKLRKKRKLIKYVEFESEPSSPEDTIISTSPESSVDDGASLGRKISETSSNGSRQLTAQEEIVNEMKRRFNQRNNGTRRSCKF